VTTASLLLLFLATGGDVGALIHEVASSGRVVEIAESPSERVADPVRIAPGAPPLLSFRLMEGKARHRFGDLDLVLDDAGH
jgi:hypothetical protein